MPQRTKLGQNFLVDRTAQSQIVAALGDLAQRTVVEIGPGPGEMTALVAARARRVVAIELDRQLTAWLREQFLGRNSVEILEWDVLQTDFAELLDKEEGRNAEGDREKLLVLGNLPYYITSDILLRLFRFAGVIERAVLMVQREVAERVAAQPGGSEYGILSATTQMYARVEKLMTLPPEAFSPPPQVHSTVLRLTFAPRFEELGVGAEEFLKFVRNCFAQKRKMLGKNLRNAGFEPAAIAAALEGCGVSSQARAEEVDLEKMACVWLRLRGM